MTVSKYWKRGLSRARLKRRLTLDRGPKGWGNTVSNAASILNPQNLPHDAALSLQLHDVGTDVMKKVVACSHLIHELELINSEYTTDNLNNLFKPGRLKSFAMRGSTLFQVHPKSFQILPLTHSLKSLTLAIYRLSDVDVTLILRAMPGLIEVNIEGVKIVGPQAIKQLMRLDLLRVLRTPKASMNREAWFMFMPITAKLELFDISEADGFETNVLELCAPNPGLSHLNFAKLTINKAVFLHLSRCFQNVKVLSLKDCSLSDLSSDQNYLKAFLALSVLETLNVAGCCLRNEAMPLVAQLTSLRSLDCSSNGDLTDTGFAHLSTLIHLSQLKASATKISGHNLMEYAQVFMPSRELDLHWCRNLTGYFIGWNFPNLQRLDLQNAGVTDNDIKDLVRALLASGNAKFHSINLCENKSFNFPIIVLKIWHYSRL